MPASRLKGIMTTLINSVKGTIISVNGQIAQVEIEGDIFPMLSEILISPDDPSIILEVFSQSQAQVFCQILSPTNFLEGCRS